MSDEVGSLLELLLVLALWLTSPPSNLTNFIHSSLTLMFTLFLSLFPLINFSSTSTLRHNIIHILVSIRSSGLLLVHIARSESSQFKSSTFIMSSPTKCFPIPARSSSRAGVVGKKRTALRVASLHLQKSYDDISLKIQEQDNDPNVDEAKLSEDAKKEMATLRYEQADTGYRLAVKLEENIVLEREELEQENIDNPEGSEVVSEKLKALNKRKLSNGEFLWTSMNRRRRLEGEGPAPESATDEVVGYLYRKFDTQGESSRRRPPAWKNDALQYYNGRSENHPPAAAEDLLWCHIAGRWHHSGDHRAAHITPFFWDLYQIGELLFGDDGSQGLATGRNALLMCGAAKNWFYRYKFVIVPVDPTESPITRWKAEIVDANIYKSTMIAGPPHFKGEDLHQRELQFLTGDRPAARFLYFHFVMAMVRMKDLESKGWQEVWAYYKEHKPFATPGPHLRKSMLMAMSKTHKIPDLQIIDSWMKEHGFEEPHVNLTEEEAAEASRRVLMAVEHQVERAEDEEASDSDDEYGNSDW